MATFNDASLYQFIGNVTRSTNTTIATLPAGAVAVIDEEGTIITESVVDAVGSGSYNLTSNIRIVQRRADGTLMFSPTFRGEQLVSKEYQTAVQDVTQVSYLGANAAGTIGGLGTITAGKAYVFDLEFLRGLGDTYTSPYIKSMAYQATSSDTQATVAKGLFESAKRNLDSRVPEAIIRTERIATGSGGTSTAAFTGSSTVYKYTKGSTTVSVYTVTADGTGTFTASTATVAASTTLTAINVPTSNGRSFTFSTSALGSGAGHTAIYIGETLYLVADAGDAAANGAAIVAAINAGTQAVASGTTTVTITYNPEKYYLPPLVLTSADDSTWTNVAVTIATGESVATKYLVDTATTSAATFTLDEPFQGETGYLYEGTTEATNTGVTTFTTAGIWGLKLSALPVSFDAITGRHELVKFYVKPKLTNSTYINPYTGTGYTYDLGFDSTLTYGDGQSAKAGTGTWKQVAEMEILSQFQNRTFAHQAYPPANYIKEASSSKQYALTTLRAKRTTAPLVGASDSFITINIAIDVLLTTNDNTVMQTVFGVS